MRPKSSPSPITLTDAGTALHLHGDISDRDRATLRHLLNKGVGDNSRRALRSDISYITAWHAAALNVPFSIPPSRSAVLAFIAHHLWDPNEKAIDAAHGMPEEVREELMRGGYLRSEGPHAPSTVRRKMSSWKSICVMADVEHPFGDPEIRKTLNLAIRATGRPRKRKSRRTVDIDMMSALLDHLDDLCETKAHDAESLGQRLKAIRDRAILSMMFASGGRRRSEIAALRMGQVRLLDPIQVDDPEWPDGLPSAGIFLGRTKTTDDEDEAMVFMTGRAVLAYLSWINEGNISLGPVFRRLSRWGQIHADPLGAQSINALLKDRLREIGEDPRDFSAHGVRGGYISSALKAGIPPAEVMEQSQHKSLNILMMYFRDERQRQGRAARIL